MKGLKNTHIEAYVRPEVIFKALATLKAIGNKHYENILTKCLYCPLVFKEGDDIFAHDKECFQKTIRERSSSQEQESEQDLNEDVEEQSTKKHDDENNESDAVSNIRKYQIANDTSCVVLNHPEVNIIVNDSDVHKKVNLR